ncbi:FRG domain-containing protein [Paraburkholderia sp. A2RI-6]|uniref:FRG domain-containing protein n=1 Tax=Paraburkholderia sp. A2RI-6 TaxID=3028371 RepID=UPI003B81BADD
MNKRVALYYANLLQLGLALKYGEDKELTQITEYAVGGTTEYLSDAPFIGLEQSANLVEELWQTKDLQSSDFIKHLRINPLFRKLDIDVDRFVRLWRDVTVEFSALREGARVRGQQPYMRFETTYLFMSVAFCAIDRIVARQSHIAKDTHDFLLPFREMSAVTGGTPAVINLGSTRQYNATLGAYFARARYLGGVERFVNERDRELSGVLEEKPRIRSGWNLNSGDIVASVNNETNNDNFLAATGDANALIEGGLFLLRNEQRLGTDLISLSFDGTVDNEISLQGYVANPSGNLLEASDSKFVDSYYQSIFDLKFLELNGLYGATDKLVHTERPFHNEAFGFARAKRKIIPQIAVNSMDELEVVIERVRASLPEKDIYFRGQGRHHSVMRSSAANQLLYGHDNPNELSLPTAASRHSFDYDTFDAAFQMHLQGMLFSGADTSKFASLRKNWSHWSVYPPCTDPGLEETSEKWFKLFYSYEWDLLSMALAQHYGIPTHGLDITNDVNVAVWFALNRWYKYTHAGQEYCWYQPLERKVKADLGEHPVIYVMATPRDLKRDLDQIEFTRIPALRPERQSAFLHYGGWGLHSNLCAEDAVVAVHLSEVFSAPPMKSVDWYFPNEQEDRFYAELLKLKRDAMAAGLEYGFKEIAEYRPET